MEDCNIEKEKVLIVVNMQNDIVNSLSKKDYWSAKTLISNILHKINNFNGTVILVYDIHTEKTFIESTEKTVLPEIHCIANTQGAKYYQPILDTINKRGLKIKKCFKCNFGDTFLSTIIRENTSGSNLDVQFCGAYLDMDVLANAIICKSDFANSSVSVDKSACVASDACSLKPAIKILKNNQITIMK